MIKNLLEKEKFEVKKAKTFEEKEQLDFLRLKNESDSTIQLKMVLSFYYWFDSALLILKVVMHGVYGGLRCGSEMKPLTFGSHKRTEDGIIVSFIGAKQRGGVSKSFRFVLVQTSL